MKWRGPVMYSCTYSSQSTNTSTGYLLSTFETIKLRLKSSMLLAHSLIQELLSQSLNRNHQKAVDEIIFTVQYV